MCCAAAGGDVCGGGPNPSSTLRDEHLLQLARRVSIGEVVGEEKPEVIGGKQIDERPVAGAAAVVEQRAPARRAILPEAVRPAGRARMLTELRSVHPLDRRGVENARALEGAALKVRDEESRHVSARRREAAGGRNLQHVERQRPELLSGELVGDRTLALRIDRQREAARAHVERLEDVSRT